MKITDDLLRKLALGTGILTGILFILSLIAVIEFPAIFKYLAIAMIVLAVIFLVLRSAYNYRNTFKPRKRP